MSEKMIENLWETMIERTNFDSYNDMWGFSQFESPKNVIYKGESLENKYKREQLWLRSDISRLLHIFDVGTPTSVALEQAELEIKKLKYERAR